MHLIGTICFIKYAVREKAKVYGQVCSSVLFLEMIAELAELKGEDKQKYLDIYESQKKLVNEKAWDGKWYIRCITDDGRYIGSEKEPQAKIWLNSQSWSVISGMGENGQTAMDSVNEYLDTDLGIKKIHPSMKDYPSKKTH